MNSLVDQYMEGSIYKKLQNQNLSGGQNQLNYEMGPAKTLQKKRTSNFREDETQLLIHLWGNPTIQNKLYLTHRKAPVMRMIAASMQEKGYNRTPDEIKTRIRNLKCLYHRIKRTVSSGSGIGTVDIDWPHYEAMDRILNKQNPEHYSNKMHAGIDLDQDDEMMIDCMDHDQDRSDNEYNYDEPSIEIKEELPDYVENDEHAEELNDSPIDNQNNESNDDQDHSDYDSSPSITSLTPTIIMKQPNTKVILPKDSPVPPSHNQTNTLQPLVIHNIKQQQTQVLQPQSQKLGQTTISTHSSITLQNPPALQIHQTHKMPSISIQTTMPSNHLTTATSVNNAMPSIPLPLLILNGVPPKKTDTSARSMSDSEGISLSNGHKSLSEEYSGLHSILKEILQVQKENLEIEKQKNESEKQRLEIEKQKVELEKQRLEYNRVMSHELTKLTPIINKLFDAVTTSSSNAVAAAINSNNNGTVSAEDNNNVLINGLKIKKFSVLRSVLEQKQKEV